MLFLDFTISGLMLDIKRSPLESPRNPCGFNSISPSELLKYIPVFLQRTPDPYPLEKVIEKWLLSSSDVPT